MKKIVLLLFCFSLFFPSDVLAVKKQTGKKSSKVSGFITKSFDLNLDKLPPNFKGHDPVRIFELFMWEQKNRTREEMIDDAIDVLESMARGEKKWEPIKREFEKTEDYEKRLRRELKSLYSNKDIFAFKISERPAISYDADSEKLHMPLYRGSDNNQFLIKESVNIGSSHRASNAFGATTNVQDATKVSYTLIALNQGALIDEIAFPFSINEAKKNRNNLDILLVCKVEPFNDLDPQPIVKSRYDYNAATFEDPFNFLIIEHKIYMELLAIWIYNSSTGEIYLKKTGEDLLTLDQ